MARTTTLTFNKANVASVAALQTTAGAANLVLSGIYVLNNYPTPAYASFAGGYGVTVSLTSTGALGGINFVITGTDVNGKAQSETLAGPANNTVFSVNFYQTVTSIASNAAVGTAISAGNGTTGNSRWVIVDTNSNVFNVGLACQLTATLTYSVVQTADDPEVITAPVTFPIVAGLTAATTNQIAAAIIPVKAFQVQVTASSGNGALTSNIIQQGISGS